jgi:tripartite-type tricarboxylate transporter receptor subunit TctC
MRRGLCVALICGFAGHFLVAAASAQSVEQFYKGRRLSLLVASAAGGGYDAYARLVTRYLGRFVPGNPTFIVQNMPGAGGAIAANYLYNVAAKDGSVLGEAQREVLVAPLLESRNIENHYDARKFNWLGSLNSETGLIVAWHTTPHKTFEDLLKSPLLVGSTGPSEDFLPIFLNKALGTKLKLVLGYRGSTDVYLAMERGEVEGRVSNGWSGDKGILAPWLRDGKVRFLVALALQKSRVLPDLPLITDFAHTATERQVLELLLVSSLWGRPFALPPGVPNDRVAALRKAFTDMTNDPDFLAEAARLDIDIEIMDFNKIDEVLAHAYQSPPDVIEAARQAIGGN